MHDDAQSLHRGEAGRHVQTLFVLLENYDINIVHHHITQFFELKHVISKCKKAPCGCLTVVCHAILRQGYRDYIRLRALVLPYEDAWNRGY